MNAPKICFIGLGDHAIRGHLDHLRGMKEIHHKIGVFDPNPALLLPSLAHGKSLLRFPSLEEALAWADAVMICSPDAYHLPQMQAAIKAGCHVFCEKPLASTADHMAILMEAFAEARAKGLVITSCHPRRFDPPYVSLREQLPALIAQLGPVMEVKLDFSYHKPSKTGLHGGSMLQDHANHEVDYLCWLLGHSPFRAWRLLDEEDRYHLSGIRTDGIAFQFGGTRRLNARTYPETMWVRFERGEVFVDTYCEGNSYVFDHETRGRPAFHAGKTDYDVRFRRMNEHWLDLIMGRTRENYLSERQLVLNTELSVAFQKGEFFEST
jgi:predicted dehydrogenase